MDKYGGRDHVARGRPRTTMNKSQKTQKKTTAQKVRKAPKSNLKLELRWKHMNQRNEYELIRATNGGGVRGISVTRTADAKSCIQLAQNLFFKNGESSKGKLEDMDFELGDYKGNVIDTSDKSFTVANYKRTYGLHTVRLVLLSKDKNNEIEHEEPLEDNEGSAIPPCLLSDDERFQSTPSTENSSDDESGFYKDKNNETEHEEQSFEDNEEGSITPPCLLSDDERFQSRSTENSSDDESGFYKDKNNETEQEEQSLENSETSMITPRLLSDDEHFQPTSTENSSDDESGFYKDKNNETEEEEQSLEDYETSMIPPWLLSDEEHYQPTSTENSSDDESGFYHRQPSLLDCL